MVTEDNREAFTKAKSSWLGNQTINNTAKWLREKYAYEITILVCVCVCVCVCVRARMHVSNSRYMQAKSGTNMSRLNSQQVVRNF